jgi:hypothetical protein
MPIAKKPMRNGSELMELYQVVSSPVLCVGNEVFQCLTDVEKICKNV